MPEPMIKLALLMQCAAGLHPGSWMHRDAVRGAATDISYYADMARLAERGLFDLFFIADTPAARTDSLQAWSRYPLFHEQFRAADPAFGADRGDERDRSGRDRDDQLLRTLQFGPAVASLDHISGGRAAWNVVTSANAYVAKNFGLDALAPHAERYARAREFVGLVRRLWDTYEDGAVVEDKASGLYFDPAKFHVTHHEGDAFRLHGALNISRPPQGHPGAHSGRRLRDWAGFRGRDRRSGVRHGDRDERGAGVLRRCEGAHGEVRPRTRPDEDPRRLSVVVAPSRQEAEDRHAEMGALMQPIVGRFFLGNDLEVDLSELPLDEPIPPELIPKEAKFHKAYFDQIVAAIRTRNPTLRELYMSYERGKSTMRGGPADIADTMQAWMAAGRRTGSC